MKTSSLAILFAVLVASAAAARAEDFQFEMPVVRAAAHPNEWQTILGKLKKYGGNISNEAMPIFGLAVIRGPENGEHRADYLEQLSAERIVFNSENWTTQISPALARRIIEDKPQAFWSFFSAWPAQPEGAERRRIEAFLQGHPQAGTVVAERSAPDAKTARKLLGFLAANPDLMKKYSHLEIYLETWMFTHEGAALAGCTHYVVLESRSAPGGGLFDDPAVVDGKCTPEGLAKYEALMKLWSHYEPGAGAPPHARMSPPQPGQPIPTLPAPSLPDLNGGSLLHRGPHFVPSDESTPILNGA